MDETPGAKRILLADDEQFIAVAYKNGLEQAGYLVEVAADGEAALQALRAAPPDLLLLDIIMPKTNGFEVLQAMQLDPALQAIPTIVLTNLTQDSDEQEARRLGAKDFLRKADISLSELLVRIDRLFAS